MNLGLVLGGVAQGASETYTTTQAQQRASIAAADQHDIAARTQRYASDVQANSPKVGSPIGSNGPSWSAEDAAMGGWGSSDPPATLPAPAAPAVTPPARWAPAVYSAPALLPPTRQSPGAYSAPAGPIQTPAARLAAMAAAMAKRTVDSAPAGALPPPPRFTTMAAQRAAMAAAKRASDPPAAPSSDPPPASWVENYSGDPTLDALTKSLAGSGISQETATRMTRRSMTLAREPVGGPVNW